MGKALPTPQSRDSGSTTNSSGHVYLHNPIFHVLLIIILGLLAYSNTFNVPFQFDDMTYIFENTAIRDLEYFTAPLKAVEINFPDRLTENFFKIRFIAFFTFALNYKIHGLDVTGYHIFNIAIHILNAILVYWLLILTFKTPYFSPPLTSPLAKGGDRGVTPFAIALLSALIFVTHPVQTQAVTYISQRFTSLATMFYLLSIVMYIRFRIQNTELRAQNSEKSFSLRSVLWYLGSIFSAVLAMLTKEITFTLPVIIALYELMFFEGKIKRRILYLIPLLSTMLIIPFNRMRAGQGTGHFMDAVSFITKEMTDMSRWDYLFTQFRVIVTYIRLLFFPVNQNLDYDYPIHHSFLEPNVFLSFLFLLSIFCLGVYLFYRSRFTHDILPYTRRPARLIAFGIFWFFITLSVESSIIPILDVVFEHRLYLPSVGVFIAITIQCLLLLNKLKTKWHNMDRILIAIFAVVILALLGTTYTRNMVWQDKISLREDIVKKSPKKARGHYNLGTTYLFKGWADKAIEQFEIAVELEPHPMTYYLLGYAYDLKGWTDIAIEHFNTAVELKPDFADAHYSLGIAYQKKGLLDKAIAEFQIASILQSEMKNHSSDLKAFVK